MSKGQPIRAGLSGIIATAVDFGAMAVLLHVFGVPVAWAAMAALVSSALGAVTNFTINKFWAFRDRSRIDTYQVMAYAMVSGLNAVIVAAFVHGFVHFVHLDPLLSKAVAALITFVLWTYPAQAKFVFPTARAARARR